MTMMKYGELINQYDSTGNIKDVCWIWNEAFKAIFVFTAFLFSFPNCFLDLLVCITFHSMAVINQPKNPTQLSAALWEK